MRCFSGEGNSLVFSHSVMSDSLRPHRLQRPCTRLPCSLLSPWVCSNSCPLSQWCYITISFSAILFSFCLQSLPVSVFSNDSALHIRWPKYWSFSCSISPSSEYSGLISFSIDWFDLLAVQQTLKESSSTPQFKSTNSSALSFLYGPTLTFIHESIIKVWALTLLISSVRHLHFWT